MTEHHYEVEVVWSGATSDYHSYSRNHEIHAAGQPSIAGSSDPKFRGDARRWDPEQMFVASLSQCHNGHPHLGADVDPMHRRAQQLHQCVGDLAQPAVQQRRQQGQRRLVRVAAQVARRLDSRAGAPGHHDLRRYVGEHIARQADSANSLQLGDLVSIVFKLTLPASARIDAKICRAVSGCSSLDSATDLNGFARADWLEGFRSHFEP